MHKYTKAERQYLIKEIIQSQGMADQVELLLALRKKGVETTQATVSRDLQEIGVIKVPRENGSPHYALFKSQPRSRLLKTLKVFFENFVSGIDGVSHMIILHTSPGNANGLANLIDQLQMKEILGTIAGDDTVLLIVNSEENRSKIKEMFQSLSGSA